MSAQSPKPLLTDEDVIEYLHDPNTVLRSPEPPLRGAEAAAHGKAFMIEQFGSEEALNEFLRRGRRRVDGSAERGESKEIRGRITPDQQEGIRRLRERTGKTQSQLVRDAIDALLAREHITI